MTLIKSIQIENFKGIEKLELHSLTKVNYIIGQNGSGKSSLIEFLSFMLGLTKGQALERYFENVYGDINMFHNKIGFLKITFENGESHSAKVKIEDEKSKIIEEIDNNLILADYYNPVVINPHTIVPHNPHAIPELINDSTLDGIVTNSENFLFEANDNRIDLFFSEILEIDKKEIINEKIRNFNQLSTGYKNLLHQFLNIDNFIQSNGIEASTELKSRHFIYLLEEPEYALHANFQKYIPKIIGHFKNYPIQFFITTHSPILINKTHIYSNSKIWFLKNGKTVDLEENINQGKDGFPSTKSVAFSAQLMGLDIEDTGYPENFCLLEEDSLRQLLSTIIESKSNFLKDIFFVSVGGESKFEKYEDLDMQNFISQDTLIKCNPFYSDNYLLIVDKYKGKSKNKKLVDYLENRKSKLNSNGVKRFIELTKDGIEDFYKNNTELISLISTDLDKLQEIKENKSGKSNEEKARALGTQKCIIAKKVGEFIYKGENPAECFSEIFENELNMLIKNT